MLVDLARDERASCCGDGVQKAERQLRQEADGRWWTRQSERARERGRERERGRGERERKQRTDRGPGAQGTVPLKNRATGSRSTRCPPMRAHFLFLLVSCSVRLVFCDLGYCRRGGLVAVVAATLPIFRPNRNNVSRWAAIKNTVGCSPDSHYRFIRRWCSRQ